MKMKAKLLLVAIVSTALVAPAQAERWRGLGDSEWVSLKACYEAQKSPCRRYERVGLAPGVSEAPKMATNARVGQTQPRTPRSSGDLAVYCNAKGGVGTTCYGSSDLCGKAVGQGGVCYIINI